MSQDNNFKQEYESGRSRAMGIASGVYTGGVLAATVIFLSFIMTAFPDTAYFIRGLMVLSGLLVGASGLAFPVALHNWAVSGNHKLIATLFYYGEICLIVLNTIVSFSALLYKFAGNTLPDWVQWYEPFTIISLGYVIAAWGTIFITDPRSKAKAHRIEVLEKFDRQVDDDMSRYLDSQDGKLAVQQAANERIRSSFQVKDRSPQPWIDNANNFSPWNCSHCGVGNMGSASFCAQCGAPRSAAAVPSQAPAVPALPRPASPSLPPRQGTYKAYSLAELLAYSGRTREQVRDMLTQASIIDSTSAFYALKESGYIPADFYGDGDLGLAADRFRGLYTEIMGYTSLPLPVSNSLPRNNPLP